MLDFSLTHNNWTKTIHIKEYSILQFKTIEMPLAIGDSIRWLVGDILGISEQSILISPNIDVIKKIKELKVEPVEQLLVAVVQIVGVAVVAVPGVTVIVTLEDPSLLVLLCIAAPASVLTAQLLAVPMTNFTLSLRRTASARASCKPFCIDSVAVRICAFSIQV